MPLHYGASSSGSVAAKARQVTADLRSLRTGAAARAAYEVSKRVGGHDLVFGRLAARATRQPARPPELFRPSPTVTPETSARTLDTAASIVGGQVRLFGRRIVLPAEPDWHATLDGDGRWPVEPWWRLDIRSDRRIADVKWTWELNRHRHLVVLARAVHLDPRNGELARLLSSHLQSWIAQNPPEVGVNWYSNLEIALRAFAWLQILALAGPALPGPLVAQMTSVLHHAGHHLMADLPYTLSSMRNNHLLGDALGLIALGQAFAGDSAARRWAAVGNRVFLYQLARHMRRDGSMVEDSLSYHRFVIEMLCARVVLGGAPPPVVQHMVSAAQLLARLGVGDGPVPQYGDWDEGRVLVSTQDPEDLLGTLRLALALGGSGAPEAWRRDHDEVCWYANDGAAVEPEQPEVGGRDVGGGMARARLGGTMAWLKAGSGPSHGHADLCSTAVAVNGEWVVGDPGTGTYNGSLAQRTYFRASVAHSVLRLGGHDQLEPHRAFRWRHSASGVVGPPLRLPNGVVMWGVHDAYRRLAPPRRVARVVVLHAGGVAVADWVSGPRGERFLLSLPLPPGIGWDGGDLSLPGGGQLRLQALGTVTAVRGSADPYDGWWSETYGQVEPATRLETTGVVGGPVWWAVAPPGAVPPGVQDGTLHLGPLRLMVEWTDDRATLMLQDGDVEQVAFLGGFR